MDNATIVKWLGILIVVVMAISMLAAAFLYAPTQDTTTVDPNVVVQNNATEFTYTANFDTITISELSSLRIRATTSEIDKQKVDEAVKKVSGVSRINSKFVTGQNGGWDYFADIGLTRSANVSETANNILNLSIFSSDPTAKNIVKIMTLTSPGKVTLTNTDLNITRDYNFDGVTLSAFVDVSTQPKDVITVSGTVKLKGKDLTFLELIEASNLSSTPITYNFKSEKTILELKDTVFLDADRNFNTFFETELIANEIRAIDENTQVFVYPVSTIITIKSSVTFSENLLNELKDINGVTTVDSSSTGLSITFDSFEIDNISAKLKPIIDKEDFSAEIIYPTSKIVAQTTTSQVSSISSVLNKYNFTTNFTQEAVFDANSLFIPELNKTFPYGTLSASVKLNHSASDSVELDLTVQVSREAIVQAYGEEK